ncbi:hypothetical protein, partial [Citrobacter sp. VF227]
MRSARASVHLGEKAPPGRAGGAAPDLSTFRADQSRQSEGALAAGVMGAGCLRAFARELVF